MDANSVLFNEALRNDSPVLNLKPGDIKVCEIDETEREKSPECLTLPVKNPRIDVMKDNRYNSFKTWSGRLERQLSVLRGKSFSRNDPEINPPQNIQGESLSADRYFDALEGPELETLRVRSKPFL